MHHGVLCLATVIPPNRFDHPTGSTASATQELVQESARGGFSHAAATIVGHVRMSFRSALDALHDANQAPHITPRRGAHQHYHSTASSTGARASVAASGCCAAHLPSALVFDVMEGALLRCTTGSAAGTVPSSQPGEVHAVFRKVQTHLTDDDLFLDCSFHAKRPSAASKSLLSELPANAAVTDDGCVILHGAQLRQAFLDCDTADSAASANDSSAGRHAIPLCRWKHLLCKTLELHDDSATASLAEDADSSDVAVARGEQNRCESPASGTSMNRPPPLSAPCPPRSKRGCGVVVGLLLHFVAIAFPSESIAAAAASGTGVDGSLSPYAVGSRSPSETSSSTATTNSSNAAHRHHFARRIGGAPSYLWDPALWLQLMSVHQQQMQRVVYGPTMDILERQFEAAVDELLTVEGTLQRLIDERDAIIAQLVEGKTTTAAEESSDSDATRPTRALTPPPPSSSFLAGFGRSASRGESKQKDMEIFLLRARLSATEAARQAEVDELRREISALKKGREHVLHKETERLLLLRKRAAAGASSAASGGGGSGSASSGAGTSASALYRPSSRPSAAAVTSSSTSSRANSASKSAMATTATPPAARQPSPSQGRFPSPSAVQARRSFSRGNSGEVPQSRFATHGTKSQHASGAGISTTASAARSEAVIAKLGAAERDERLRRLEESYVKLQTRNMAVLSPGGLLSADGTGIGTAATTTTQPTTTITPTDAAPQSKPTFFSSSGTAKSELLSGPPGSAPPASAGSHNRRTVSPLRIPVKVPGLKAVEPLPSSVGDEGSAAAGSSARGGVPGFSVRSHSRHESPSAQRSYDSAAAAVPSSVLRTSPLRITESLSKLRVR